MRFATLYYLDPEVAGDFGDRTIISNTERYRKGEDAVPRIVKLEYEFDCWQGDELVQAFPCYLASKRLVQEMRMARLTGLSEADLEICTSSAFDELCPEMTLPEFSWLIPIGRVSRFFKRTTPAKANVIKPSWSGDDLCIGPKGELLITSHALEVIGVERISHCTIQPVLASLS